MPARNDGKLDAGSAQHLHSVPIAGMKRLVLDTVVAQQQPAVGEHAVYIEYYELHLSCPRKNFR